MTEAERDTLLAAHLAEMEAAGAEATNLGAYEDQTTISSKTTKGRLTSKLKDGNILHGWEGRHE